MYIKIGDGTFHQGSVISVHKLTAEKKHDARVIMALGEGASKNIRINFEEGTDVDEKIDEIHEQLEEDAQEKLQKRRSQMQMAQGGGLT
jgi:hypothetical protein